MVRRCLIAVLAALVVATGTGLVQAGPAWSVETAGWASWGPITGSSNNFATTMQLPAKGFPKATVATDSRSDVKIPSGATTFLGGPSDPVPTDVGTKYGSSKGHPYLNLRPKADNATSPSTTTYTFADPTPPTGWTFVLGDVDSDQVQISAKDANGDPLTAAQINQWKTGHDVFNYAGDSDRPTWNAATSTLVGNPGAVDTDGASAWFEPDVSISSLTFVFTRRAGFPIYQTWFASLARTISGTVTDVSSPGHSCPIDSSTVTLIGPAGDQLASIHPSGGAYSFGQYATQPGYHVSIEWPAQCAVVGADDVTVSNAAGDATADFSLRQVIPQPVSGVIKTTAGTPVAGVEVTLTPPGGPARTTTTDADGAYLFDNNAEVPGYTIAVTGPPDGFAVDGSPSRTFGISPGTPVTEDFTLTEQPSLSGKVTGGGDPLGGVTVTLTPTGGGAAVTTSTLGDGTYSFAHVPTGSYDIAVTAPSGYSTVGPRTGVNVGSTDVTDQDFDLDRPGALGGQVADTDGALVPDAHIDVSGPGGPDALTTDADGQYFLGGLSPGTYDIALTVPDGYVHSGVTQRTVDITAAGEIRGGQDFTVARRATPTGGGSTSPTGGGSASPTGGGSASPTGRALPGGSGTEPVLAASGAPTGRLLLLGLVLLALGGCVARGARAPARRR